MNENSTPSTSITADGMLRDIAARLELVAEGEAVGENAILALQRLLLATHENIGDASPPIVTRVVLALAAAVQPVANHYPSVGAPEHVDFAFRSAAGIARLFLSPVEETPDVEHDVFLNWFDTVAIAVAQIDIAVRLKGFQERRCRRVLSRGSLPAGATLH